MKLMPITVVERRNGHDTASRALVNMDKFIDAIPADNGYICMWLEGPFSFTLTQQNFLALLQAMNMPSGCMPARLEDL